MAFNPQDIVPPGAKIKVIGVGGGGGNAVNTMIRTNIEGVEFIAANTDVQSLQFSLAGIKIQVGKELTKGLGAGADPDIGRDAALEDRHAIQEALEGANMVFVTAGMGGGTGTGGAAVAAQIARELGALTVGVVTKPFAFEGKRRLRHAEIGISRLQEHVDTLITIPNQRLLQVASPDLSMIDAFRMADNVLVNAVRGISDIINVPGTVNVDFADVKAVMSSMGRALMGIGIAEGEERAVHAARQAVSSPLLEDIDIEGATGILINITAGEDITLMEVNQACCIVQEAAHEDCNIIFGAVIDENMGRQIRVTVIATGFPSDHERDVPREQGSGKETNKSLYQPIKLPDPKPAGLVLPKPVTKTTLVSRPAATPAAPKLTQTAPIKAQPASQPAPAPQPMVKPRVEMPPPPAPREPEPQAMAVEELTHLTMNPVRSTAPIENAPLFPTFDEEMAAIAEEPAADDSIIEAARLEGAKRATADEMLASEPDLSDDFFSYLDGDAGGAPAITPPPPPVEEEKTDEMLHSLEEKRIDEALELADRISSSQAKDGGNADQDDLDVPAFLRNGMKDLSLS